jgi:methionyl aminopeptidase
MFLANGEYDDSINRIKKVDSIECFTEEKPDTPLFGVGEIPVISDEDIINAQKLMSEKGDKLDTQKSLEIGSLFHKKIRSIIRPHLKPGLKLSKLAELIEGNCKLLTKGIGINKGIGFPSSLSVNECAAHFTPSKASDIVLDNDSITKIDFGVEINGWITDCAFTIAFNNKYDTLLKAVKEATDHGIKTVAMDQDIGEWGDGIREIMESYEVKIGDDIHKIKSIKNLGGHNILKGRIHGGDFLPSFNHTKGLFSESKRFTENVYAVETFGTTGHEVVKESSKENSIYMKNYRSGESDFSFKTRMTNDYLKVFDLLNNNFKTMPFCDRYLETMSVFKHLNLDNPKKLINFKKDFMEYYNSKNIIKEFPPLYTTDMTAQYEHTILLSDNKKIVFSNSTDY